MQEIYWALKTYAECHAIIRDRPHLSLSWMFLAIKSHMGLY